MPPNNPGWKRSGNRRWQPVANEAMVATRWHLVIPEDPQLAARKPRTRLQAGGRRFEPCTAYGIEALWHLTRAPGWHYGHQGETAGRNILEGRSVRRAFRRAWRKLVCRGETRR